MIRKTSNCKISDKYKSHYIQFKTSLVLPISKLLKISLYTTFFVWKCSPKSFFSNKNPKAISTCNSGDGNIKLSMTKDRFIQKKANTLTRLTLAFINWHSKENWYWKLSLFSTKGHLDSDGDKTILEILFELLKPILIIEWLKVYYLCKVQHFGKNYEVALLASNF